ncbi:MAG TPA: class I tRNA ligase family protein, partial [Acidobacteriota bacterium]|nr:class I tRNA ligase family protein [Acidobacteriota bacterium]
IDPLEILKTMGAEILRAWVAMVDYREEISIGKETLDRVAEAYRKIRNTFRYLISNLYDFNPVEDSVKNEELEPLDRWALDQLSELTQRVVDAYEGYEYHIVYHSLYRFCVVEMSAFYLDINKDRLYVSHPQSKKRRAAQTAMYRILDQLVRLAAPVFSFTTEEVWREMPAVDGKAESVHLMQFHSAEQSLLTQQEKTDWARLAEYREVVLKLMEEARQRKEIGSSLEAEVVVHYPSDDEQLIRQYELFLPELFIASQVSVQPSSELRFEVRKAEGKKCMRCWQIRKDVGQNANYPEVCARCAAVLEELAV